MNPTHTPDEGVINLDRARSRVGDDDALLADLAAIFLDSLPGWIDDLDQAVKTHDGPSIVRAAHTIKGSADVFDATRVSESARQLERMGREQDFGQIDEAWGALEAEIVRLRRALNDLLDRP